MSCVTRIDASRSAPPHAVGPHARSQPTTPLVGRSSILASLEGALAQAQLGRGSVRALLGGAGVGKTRLSEELKECALRAGFAVTWSHCRRMGGAPALWPFMMLRRAWGVPVGVLERRHVNDGELTAASAAPETY